MESPDLYRRAELAAAGFAAHELDRARRRGTLTAVRRGTYIVGVPPTEPELEHATRVRAAIAELATGSVVSHQSAVILHGLASWHLPLARVHATRDRTSGGRRDPLLHLHSAPLAPHEIVGLGGILVTALPRTVVDVARTLSFEAAVVIADAALASGKVSREELDEALRRATRWRGVPAARRAVEFADGRSESVGESRSRVAIMLAGLAAPDLQAEVRDPANGRFVGRVDFEWPGRGVIGEFDGESKYRALVPDGQTAADVVIAEKIREDALTATGRRVIRWTWSDLADFAPTAAKIRRALASRVDHADRGHSTQGTGPLRGLPAVCVVEGV